MRRDLPGARRQLPLLATGDHSCPYFDERIARTAFVDPRLHVDPGLYRVLLDRGFRRSGSYLYRPACPECTACRTLRIPVQEFRPRRRHRRCLTANADVRTAVREGCFNAEHYQLYQRYVSTRHAGGSMDNPTPATYREFLFASWCDTAALELREGDRLLAVAITDLLDDALSAIYTFYEPGLPKRSLGMLGILSQIRLAAAEGREWLYLGYWIDGCPRMTYKSEYRPHEVLTPDGWVRSA